MADRTVVGKGALIPTGRRKKPKLAVRGRRRKEIRKLRDVLRAVFNQDQTESNYAEKKGYIPYLFVMTGSTPNGQQFAAMIARCNAVLEATI